MRKFSFLLTALLLVNLTFAQSRAFIVNESFDSPNMPEGWYFTGDGADNFEVRTTNNAGGDPNELYFKSIPPVTAGIHLVMGTADLTNVSELGLSFRHNLSYDQLTHTLGFATSSDNGTTWNKGWSQTFSDASSSGKYEVNTTFSTSDMGKANVLICMFYEGNTYNFNKWYFDDIRIFTQGGEEGKANAQISNIDINSIIPSGATDISFTVNNTGSVAITSFEASYEINGEVVSETFQANLNAGANNKYTFSTKANIKPGTFTVNINILSINDVEVEDEISASKEIKTYIRTVARTPMIEHFSSSTCDPCVQVDGDMKTLISNNPGKYTYTKFPASWPGHGDPYSTKECDDRCLYYSVSNVPIIALDGQTGKSAVSQEKLDERLNTISYVDIVGAFEAEGNTINVVADIISYIDMPNVRVFLTINEKTTTGNVGTNGLTEFHHIMLKMLGGSSGIETSFKVGEYQRFEFTHDMTTTFMEEIEDLEVSVYIQNYESKEVHNSSFLHEYMQHPYPAQNLTVTDRGTDTEIIWDAPEQGNPVGYNVYINNQLAAEKITNTAYSASATETVHFVEVIAVYENDIYSIGITNMRSIDCFPPDNVKAVNNDTEKSITVTWDPVNGAASYKLYRNNSFLADVNATTYTDNNVSYDVEYCYTLRSVYNETSISSFSQEACALIKGTGVNEETANELSIYPNPVENRLFINTNENINTINIYNVVGINVYSEEKFSSNSIDVSNLNNGIYIIKINTAQGDIVRRFVKE